MTQTCKSCNYIDRQMYESSKLSHIHCKKGLTKDVDIDSGETPMKACSHYINYYLQRDIKHLNDQLLIAGFFSTPASLPGWRNIKKEESI